MHMWTPKLKYSTIYSHSKNEMLSVNLTKYVHDINVENYKIFIKIIPHTEKNSVTNEFWNTNENIPNLLQNGNTKPPSSNHKVFHVSA